MFMAFEKVLENDVNIVKNDKKGVLDVINGTTFKNQQIKEFLLFAYEHKRELAEFLKKDKHNQQRFDEWRVKFNVLKGNDIENISASIHYNLNDERGKLIFTSSLLNRFIALKKIKEEKTSEEIINEFFENCNRDTQLKNCCYECANGYVYRLGFNFATNKTIIRELVKLGMSAVVLKRPGQILNDEGAVVETLSAKDTVRETYFFTKEKVNFGEWTESSYYKNRQTIKWDAIEEYRIKNENFNYADDDCYIIHGDTIRHEDFFKDSEEELERQAALALEEMETDNVNRDMREWKQQQAKKFEDEEQKKWRDLKQAIIDRDDHEKIKNNIAKIKNSECVILHDNWEAENKKQYVYVHIKEKSDFVNTYCEHVGDYYIIYEREWSAKDSVLIGITKKPVRRWIDYGTKWQRMIETYSNNHSYENEKKYKQLLQEIINYELTDDDFKSETVDCEQVKSEVDEGVFINDNDYDKAEDKETIETKEKAFFYQNIDKLKSDWKQKECVAFDKNIKMKWKNGGGLYCTGGRGCQYENKNMSLIYIAGLYILVNNIDRDNQKILAVVSTDRVFYKNKKISKKYIINTDNGVYKTTDTGCILYSFLRGYYFDIVNELKEEKEQWMTPEEFDEKQKQIVDCQTVAFKRAYGERVKEHLKACGFFLVDGYNYNFRKNDEGKLEVVVDEGHFVNDYDNETKKLKILSNPCYGRRRQILLLIETQQIRVFNAKQELQTIVGLVYSSWGDKGEAELSRVIKTLSSERRVVNAHSQGYLKNVNLWDSDFKKNKDFDKYIEDMAKELANENEQKHEEVNNQEVEHEQIKSEAVETQEPEAEKKTCTELVVYQPRQVVVYGSKKGNINITCGYYEKNTAGQRRTHLVKKVSYCMNGDRVDIMTARGTCIIDGLTRDELRYNNEKTRWEARRGYHVVFFNVNVFDAIDEKITCEEIKSATMSTIEKRKRQRHDEIKSQVAETKKRGFVVEFVKNKLVNVFKRCAML